MPRDIFPSNLVYILFVVSLDNLSPKFFEVYKGKKTSSFGCGCYIVYVAQSQERKTTAREMLM